MINATKKHLIAISILITAPILMKSSLTA